MMPVAEEGEAEVAFDTAAGSRGWGEEDDRDVDAMANDTRAGAEPRAAGALVPAGRSQVNAPVAVFM